ncbi:MAG: type III-B CRISPR module RAMP protein Cmr4 [Thiotrichaceae bacterium IS1]|nr:MAG: type III-B CRISPR module RAMP protein Cmr4 [Thiotrichaceae bacterium IS1]
MSEQKQSPFAKAILGLLTETSLHAGTGQTVGVIDLPIQREAATDYPCVFGSSVKGAMRGWAGRSGIMEPNLINLIFGPEDDGAASEYASALAVSDARLLLLPVRSLTTHFKWVTCPAVLKRFQADCQRLSISSPAFEMNEVFNDENSAWVATAPPQSNGLFLEEFRFKQVPSILIKDKLIPQIAQLMGRKEAVEMLTNQLVIIHDNMFRIICKFATPVNAHIRLNKETKIVEQGALWYEETLPSETLMYTCLLASHSRKQKKEGGSVLDATGVLAKTLELFPENAPYLQLGGNETVGMGWCKVTQLKVVPPN